MELHYKYGGWIAYEDDPIDWDRIEKDGWPLVLKREDTLTPKIEWYAVAGCVTIAMMVAGWWGLAAWLIAR